MGWRRAILPLGVFLLGILIWGVGFIPSGALESMATQAAHPFVDYGQPTYHWQQPLWLLWASWAGITTVTGYQWWSAGWALWAVLVACGAAWMAWGRLWAVLVLVSPISYILTTWIGLEDPLIVVCTAAVLWGGGPVMMAGAGLLGALTHPIAVIAPAMVLVLRRRNRGGDAVTVEEMVWWGMGTVVGGIICMAAVPPDIMAEGRWARAADRSLWEWAVLSSQQLPVALYGMAFGVWVPLVWAVRGYWLESMKFFNAFAVCMVIALALTMVTLDTSRVLALLTWAPILLALRRAERIASAGPSGWDHAYLACLVWTGWLGILAPRVCIWSGRGMMIPFLEWLR